MLFIDPSAAPSLLTTTVCLLPTRLFKFFDATLNHYPKTPAGPFHQLTCHSRRVQVYHGIIPQMYSIASRHQRPRVSPVVQIIPWVPNGPVCADHFLFRNTPALYTPPPLFFAPFQATSFFIISARETTFLWYRPVKVSWTGSSGCFRSIEGWEICSGSKGWDEILHPSFITSCQDLRRSAQPHRPNL